MDHYYFQTESYTTKLLWYGILQLPYIVQWWRRRLCWRSKRNKVQIPWRISEKKGGKKEVNAENEPRSSERDSPNKHNNSASGINYDTNGILLGCRIHTTLDLFRDNEDGNFEVKFKDDVSLSEFEDSNEESN